MARRAGDLFAKNAAWLHRLKLCVTFGTPHRGAGLAEHPDRTAGALVLLAWSTRCWSEIAALLAYIEARGDLQGIADLVPPSVEDSFLMKLQAEESAHAPTGARRLPILAVGGDFVQPTRAGRLERLAWNVVRVRFGHLVNDGVVSRDSALAAASHGAAVDVQANHFGYFDGAGDNLTGIDQAIARIWEVFGLASVIGPLMSSPPTGGIDVEEDIVRIGDTELPRR